MDILKIKSQLTTIGEASDKLTEWEKDFIKSIAEKLEKWGDTANVSEKQIVVLDKIFAKATK